MLHRSFIIMIVTSLLVYIGLCLFEPLPLYIECLISMVIMLLASILPVGKKKIRIIYLLAVLIQIRYLIWRTFFTLDYESSADFLAVYGTYAADLFFSVMVVTTAFFKWHLEPNDTLAPIKLEECRMIEDQSASVDVFICTLNEPVEILRRTICAAKNIDYTNKMVYVLDDGAREEIEQLALELEVNYISRVERTYYKAGNLNNAFKQTNGDFILSLDSDHLPAVSILKIALPHFEKDNNVWAVQFAYRYLNPGIVEKTVDYPRGNTQKTYFDFIGAPAMDKWGSMIWFGSCAVLKRESLDQINGIAVGSIAEDVHTTYELLAKKWKTVYVPVPQSLALCPETIRGHFTQQIRWCTGSLHLIFFKGLLFKKGLSLPQRLCLFHNGSEYLSCFPTMWYILFMPLVVILLKGLPVSVSANEIMVMWLPLFYVVLLRVNTISGMKNSHSIVGNAYVYLCAPVLMAVQIKKILTGYKLKFKATEKGRLKSKRSNFDFLWIYLPMLFLIFFAAVNMSVSFILFPSLMIIWVVFIWYCVLILTNVICVVLEDTQPTSMHSVDINLEASLLTKRGDIKGRLVRVSDSGATISTKSPYEIRHGEQSRLKIVADQKSMIHKIRILGVRKGDNGECLVDLSFFPFNNDNYLKFVDLAYCSNESWQKMPNIVAPWALSNFIVTPFKCLRLTISRLNKFIDRKLSYD